MPMLRDLRRHRRRHARLYRNGSWGLIGLVGAFVVAQVGLVVVGRLDAFRLSGTAPLQLVATSFTAGSSYEQAPAGTSLRYTYVVDGTTFPGEVFRPWVDVGAHRPKVCYDPANPASHTVVDGDHQCGRD